MARLGVPVGRVLEAMDGVGDAQPLSLAGLGSCRPVSPRHPCPPPTTLNGRRVASRRNRLSGPSVSRKEDMDVDERMCVVPPDIRLAGRITSVLVGCTRAGAREGVVISSSNAARRRRLSARCRSGDAGDSFAAARGAWPRRGRSGEPGKWSVDDRLMEDVVVVGECSARGSAR